MTAYNRGPLNFDCIFFVQDTVVALQALAAYSDKTKGRGLDLRVKIRSELDINWKPAEIHITKENALLRRAIDVSKKFMFCLKNEQKCIIRFLNLIIHDCEFFERLQKL